MIIELGYFNKVNEQFAIKQMKKLVDSFDGHVYLGFIGDSKKYTYKNALKMCIDEFGNEILIKLLFPFTNDVQLFKKAFDKFTEERLNTFESQTIEELRIEAYERFDDERWLNIEKIVDLYRYEIYGKVVFAEMM